MKRLFRALLMCVSMFTALPVPGNYWDEAARPLMTACLPAVGLLIGGVWAALELGLKLAGAPKLISALVLSAYPFLVTGGIHMDGYLDVTDAVKSWRDAGERRKILKDPNVGSFAVLAAVLLILTQFALFASAGDGARWGALVLIPVVSRTSSALAVTILRPMGESEYAGAYRRGVSRGYIVALSLLLAAELIAGFALLGLRGLAGLAVVLGYGHHLAKAFRNLGGMSGDIAGYALTFAETCGIAVYALI